MSLSLYFSLNASTNTLASLIVSGYRRLLTLQHYGIAYALPALNARSHLPFKWSFLKFYGKLCKGSFHNLQVQTITLRR